jgi:2-phosphoglycolate phosphatase
MKHKVNVMIFDFDGVLINSGDDIANAINYTLEHFGRPVLSKDEIISYVGKGAGNLIRACFKVYDEALIEKVLPFYKKYYLEHSLVETCLYPNVGEILEAFKDKGMGIVSNKPEDITLSILEGLGIRKYFEIIIGPESVENMKPHPEGLLKVVGFFNDVPGNAIMVGDSYTDVEAGKAAGTLTCGVTYGLGSVALLEGASPDFLMGDIGQLVEVVE